jgi:hypothetical protein
MAQKSASRSSKAPKPRVRPLWFPEKIPMESLPMDQQNLMTDLIDELYKELVLEAPTELERSAGLSFVYATWIEGINQLDTVKCVVAQQKRGEGLEGTQDALRRVARAMADKERLTKLLLQVKAFAEKQTGGRDRLRFPEPPFEESPDEPS